MYSLIRQALFQFNPEMSHALAMHAIDVAHRRGMLRHVIKKIEARPLSVMGLTFPNGVGLAAGFDKDGMHIDALGDLGFGFVEVGTVTPRPQPGNPTPRLFRLSEDRALINRMGFNNRGVDSLVTKIAQRRFPGVLGVNIGKNKTTPNEEALNDYLTCYRKVFRWADYIVVNVSSPNTPELRKLQGTASLSPLLTALLEERERQSATVGKRHSPLLVKIAPDLSQGELEDICRCIREVGIDGIIATNTTLARPESLHSSFKNEQGGLSGSPLTTRSREVVALLRSFLPPAMAIIGVGGIMTGADAALMYKAGANLVQLYSGFIYGGPGLVAEAASAVDRWAYPRT